MRPILFWLGICSGYAGDDYDTSVVLCEMEQDAKRRAIILPDGLEFDDLNMNIIVIGR